jgi:integrase
MRWSAISAEGVWTIGREPREKGNAGVLQLPRLALNLIERQPRVVGNAFIFAGKHGSPKSFDHRHKTALEKVSGTSGWRLHDLRRSARSLMSRAGVANDHAELVLDTPGEAWKASTICMITKPKKGKPCAS